MPLKAILFDKDGTLVDFDRTWGPAAYEVMIEMTGGDPEILARLAEVNHYDVPARRMRRTSPMIAGSSASYGHLWAEVLGRPNDATLHREMNDRFREWGRRSLSPIGDPLAVLARLAADGYRLGIATNDAEASALAQADALGLIPHLDFIAGYDSGHGGKPEPGMVLAFAEKFELDPAEVALVGDSTHDLVAARAAGAVAIAVLSGPAGRDELEADADHIVDTIADLPEYLRGLGG